MQSIFGNVLPVHELTKPTVCYCVAQSGLVYDIYVYEVLAPEGVEITHEFHEAFRLILVPVGKALCNDAGDMIKVGMFLR